MKFVISLLVFTLSIPATSALPPDAQAYLNKIPQKKLTLPYVIGVAIQTSQSYRVVGYSYATAELEEMGKGALTDTILMGEMGYYDNNGVSATPFQGNRNRRSEWSLGLSKNWGTGTQTTIKWLQQDFNTEFDGGATSAFTSQFLADYKQSTAVILLEQSLLKDSFGFAYRKQQQAARARGESIQWETRNQLEQVTMEFITQFYQSWLLQQNVTSLKEQVERQKRLVRILSRRAKKGAVERPDLIQIETLLATSKTSLSGVQTELANQWDKLAVSLSFPESFFDIDPMDVPTGIDNPVPLAIRVCGNKEPIKTAKVYSLEKQLEGYDQDFKASKNLSLPDLKLVAGYTGNGIDPSRAGQAADNVLKGDNGNFGFGRGPAWNVGLKMSWPLSNSAVRSQRTENYIKREKTAAELQIEVDTLKTNWRDLCRKLRVENDNEKLFENVVKEQRKRVKGNERRFRLGRLGVGALVDSENDLGSWQLRYYQKKMETRSLAWQVQQASGDMYRYLSPYIRPLLKGQLSETAD